MMFAGPGAAAILGDFGADVIKVEHPRGDPARDVGHHKDGIGLWWKEVGRNKRAITLNLSLPKGQKLMRGIVQSADVLIEAFRPGTLERWNLGPNVLQELNPKLVIARVTGFGQFGPYNKRPGFGTLAEAMSGFATLTGEEDGPPTLAPFALADGIAGLATSIAILIALHARAKTGKGQIIDTAIIEPIFSMLGPQAMCFDQLGLIQRRAGNRSINTAPRNAYQTADGYWVAITAPAPGVAKRVMAAVGHAEVNQKGWLDSRAERAKHSDELDQIVASWIKDRSFSEVIAAFDKAEAPLAPVYDIKQIMDDPQFKALGSITTVQDPDLGPLKMTNVMFRLSDTPGRVQWAGRRKGQDNEEVYKELLDLDTEHLKELAAEGVI
ncbi:MAG: CoA transferase [Acidobacteriota bacterium]|nr:CoA transferase [Acidobacteriota bacterium]